MGKISNLRRVVPKCRGVLCGTRAAKCLTQPHLHPDRGHATGGYGAGKEGAGGRAARCRMAGPQKALGAV